MSMPHIFRLYFVSQEYATDEHDIQLAHALACYACRLPTDFQYPGETPFTHFGEASRLFYSAQLGEEKDQAIAFFRQEAEEGK